MTDQGLLMFGVGVTFIFVAGVYVFVGQRLERGPQEGPRPIEQTRTELRKVGSQT